jgi:hypothetical protein
MFRAQNKSAEEKMAEREGKMRMLKALIDQTPGMFMASDWYRMALKRKLPYHEKQVRLDLQELASRHEIREHPKYLPNGKREKVLYGTFSFSDTHRRIIDALQALGGEARAKVVVEAMGERMDEVSRAFGHLVRDGLAYTSGANGNRYWKLAEV